MGLLVQPARQEYKALLAKMETLVVLAHRAKLAERVLAAKRELRALLGPQVLKVLKVRQE
jgi:hypothetical protein